jgi:hypothetical protein
MGACGMCGGAGQACCGGTCSAAQTTCVTVTALGDSCLACGGRGQPCCFDQPPVGLCAANLVCGAGGCVER